MLEVVTNKPLLQNQDDDKDLLAELTCLVDRIMTNKDQKSPNLLLPTIDMLKYLIRTSTTSVTSVPKPIKLLIPFVESLKSVYKTMPTNLAKRALADVLSVLAMGSIIADGTSKDMDCLNFCLEGNIKNVGDWGHDYIRQLELEVVHEWVSFLDEAKLLPIVHEMIAFDFSNHDEIQGCDLLMEINQTHLLYNYVNKDNYEQICLYLMSCTKYLEQSESEKVKNLTYKIYFENGNYTKALVVALMINDSKLVESVFANIQDRFLLYQLAFICARHFYPVNLDVMDAVDDEEIANILNNNSLSGYFLSFVRDLDILEAKLPEDVYKIWLEQNKPSILGEKLDSAKQNLASSFVNGFVNCGFGTDKLLTAEDGGNKWIFRNKDLGMMSATAALGLIFLWDVDGGLTPIDKFLYSTEPKIKAGALLALGIVNCRVRNECDPALALLCDYVDNAKEEIQIGAILGIGLAYVGSGRDDVLDILYPVIETTKNVKILSICSLSCGLISLGVNKNRLPSLILSKIIETNCTDVMKSPFMLLTALGVALCYFNAKDNIDVPSKVVEMLEEPFQTMFQVLLKMCAYAGTGDVIIVQELLRIVEDKPANGTVADEEQHHQPSSHTIKDSANTSTNNNKLLHHHHSSKKRYEWDPYMGQSLAVLAAATVAMGEEIGMEMIERILGQSLRYGESTVRKAVPLAIALTSLSNPQPHIINILTKMAHDPSDDDVACNAIFSLGCVGAGTNNARLAQILRQLAQFHAKNPAPLFMVRLAQGLVHLGKGTMSLDPAHQNRQLIDPVGLASILVPFVCLIKPHTLILGRSHYLLYILCGAIQPRWLMMLDFDDLKGVNVVVRVGQALDVVGKAGEPKTITGIRTHSTPVLLTSGERAELVGDDMEVCASNLEGICIVRKKDEFL